MFRLTIFVVVTGLQVLCYTRALRWAAARFPGSTRARRAVTVTFALFTCALFVALFLGRTAALLPGWFTGLIARPFYIWEGGTLGLGLALLAGLLVALPFRLGFTLLRRAAPVRERLRAFAARPSAQRFDASRRAFLTGGMEGLAVASFGAATYGVLGGRFGYQLTETTLSVRGLPAAFEGFTIALVSDIHSSSFMTKKQMDGYCAAIMKLGADMIAVPGDFVNSQTEEVYPFAESFSALRAPAGVFGVMGNHDFFAPDPERVAREVDGCGVRLLRNDHTVIRRHGAQLALFGIDDVGRADRAASAMAVALRGAPAAATRILLCHRPYFLEQAASSGMDVVLAGHTHGGQIVFARVGSLVLTPAAIASPYIAGRYALGGTQMYVSRGIGTVGLPMRVNCPPELTLITLRGAAPGGAS
ncbi:MAG TPA: metallophosphoesterase [Bacteroidota bacterium]|nr:metallophosphoesterase [Bacteroidota bacterium]